MYASERLGIDADIAWAHLHAGDVAAALMGSVDIDGVGVGTGIFPQSTLFVAAVVARAELTAIVSFGFYAAGFEPVRVKSRRPPLTSTTRALPLRRTGMACAGSRPLWTTKPCGAWGTRV